MHPSTSHPVPAFTAGGANEVVLFRHAAAEFVIARVRLSRGRWDWNSSFVDLSDCFIFFFVGDRVEIRYRDRVDSNVRVVVGMPRAERLLLLASRTIDVLVLVLSDKDLFAQLPSRSMIPTLGAETALSLHAVAFLNEAVKNDPPATNAEQSVIRRILLNIVIALAMEGASKNGL